MIFIGADLDLAVYEILVMQHILFLGSNATLQSKQVFHSSFSDEFFLFVFQTSDFDAHF